MDLLRETAPFLIGMIVPPIVMLVIRPGWSGQSKFLAAFLPALVLDDRHARWYDSGNH